MTPALDLVGIGSVVLDRISRCDSILAPDTKGMVRGVTEVVGGVTLNHLAWARVLGLRTGLFGRQGDDAPGALIRAYCDRLGIDRSHLRTDGEGTSTANIFVDPRGERCIYMNRAATETTTPAHIDTYFAEYIRSAAVVSTEISQLPLDTTVRVLETAVDAGIPTALDVDIPPAQAIGEAALGTREQLDRALALATVVKPAGSALQEWFAAASAREQAEALYAELLQHGRVRLIAVTDGGNGSVLCDGERTVQVPAYEGVSVVDATGAGDAYFGALLAGWRRGLDLETLGKVANACGAACVERTGATPEPGVSRARALELYDGPPLDLPPEAAAVPAETDPLHDLLRLMQDELRTWAADLEPAAVRRAADVICAAVRDGGRVHVTGVGKPAYVAQYGAALFSSTGTPAYYLNATECCHGSAGQVEPGDAVIALSNSGATIELLAAAQTVRGLGARLVGITANPQSELARQCDVVIPAHVSREGGPLGLAPRASVLVQVAALCALSVELQIRCGLSRDAYAARHPGGALGRTARGQEV